MKVNDEYVWLVDLIIFFSPFFLHIVHMVQVVQIVYTKYIFSHNFRINTYRVYRYYSKKQLLYLYVSENLKSYQNEISIFHNDFKSIYRPFVCVVVNWETHAIEFLINSLKFPNVPNENINDVTWFIWRFIKKQISGNH